LLPSSREKTLLRVTLSTRVRHGCKPFVNKSGDYVVIRAADDKQLLRPSLPAVASIASERRCSGDSRSSARSFEAPHGQAPPLLILIA
jgi:hypothetical protein